MSPGLKEEFVLIFLYIVEFILLLLLLFFSSSFIFILLISFLNFCLKTFKLVLKCLKTRNINKSTTLYSTIYFAMTLFLYLYSDVLFINWSWKFSNDSLVLETESFPTLSPLLLALLSILVNDLPLTK